MMRGETVYVDGAPVDNVLVRPGEHLDEADVSVPAGTVIAYTLGFPASYPGSISGAKVTVRGHTCDSVGFCDHVRPRDVFGDAWDAGICPWDMTVPVQLCEGAMDAEISIMSTSAVYDGAGRPVRTSEAVYEGTAQARRSQSAAGGGEDLLADGSKRPVETWFFVVPWQDSFAVLRPSNATVAMGGAVYDVSSIENVGGRSEYASFEAVRHG